MLIASEAEKQTPYFEKNVSEHIVKQVSGDDDVVKLWRCGKPGSSTYMFYICSAPNCFFIYGDMGECIWQRNYDMIPWVRGAIDSFDYFASKTPASVRDSITEIKTELIDEWFANFKNEWMQYGEEWTEEVAEKLASIKYEYELYGSPDDFLKALYESGFYDCELPDFKGYTYTYMWQWRAVKWFIEKLYSGEVIK